MNIQDKFEKCLRAAPNPPAPDGLLDKLRADVAVRQTDTHVGVVRKWFAPSGGAISRWRVAAAIAIMVLLPLSYGATKLIKRFITISQLSTIKNVNFPFGGALSPDGKHFAGVTINTRLIVIDTSTGEKKRLTENCTGAVVWSGDGNEIAVIGGKEKQVLLAVSLKTGKAHTLMEDPPWLKDWSQDEKLILGERIPESDVYSAAMVNTVVVNLESKEETVLAKGWVKPRFSPNGDWVSYVTEEANKSILHLQKIDGTSDVKYTDFPGDIYQPLWSPDGSHIVFWGTQRGIDCLYHDLWALRVEGNRFVGSPFPVVPDVGQKEFYNWSQNGQLAYRMGFQLGGIFVLPVDRQTGKATGPPRQLVRGAWIPCWLPDGKQIAVRQMGGGRELTLISASTGEQIRKLSLAETTYTNREMSWSPDGRLIAFCGRDKEKRVGIFLAAVETGEVRLLVPLETANDPTWSPDSKTIAYEYQSNVYIVNIEDGKPRRITSPAEKDEGKRSQFSMRPVFAPDGKSVAYVAGRRILTTTIDGKETREIFQSKAENVTINMFYVDLSPDGRHIVFTLGNKGIWCAPTDDGEPFKIGDIPNLGSRAFPWGPKWSPKGDAIIFGVNCEKYQYWVMENFLSAAKATGR